MALIKRRIQDVAKGLVATKEPEEKPLNMAKVISTGSTLLDLAISGRIRRGGGIPGGILMELAGLPMGGKTTILGEMCADAQSKGGRADIGDAERRMTTEFIKSMGIQITEDNLHYPQLIKEAQELIMSSPDSENGSINLVAIDSVAVLLSELEDEKGDKRGSTRAKEMHQLCRKAKAIISDPTRLVVFTNQVQDVQDPMPGQAKTKTAGGYAIPFLASLRLAVTQIGKVEKAIKLSGKDLKRAIGVHSKVKVVKSSIDAPYREADIYIIFDYGIDDIRANLIYIKENSAQTTYWAVTDSFNSLDKAIHYIEENNLQGQLKDATINMWTEIDEKFQTERAPKVRN
jgi:protein RecA